MKEAKLGTHKFSVRTGQAFGNKFYVVIFEYHRVQFKRSKRVGWRCAGAVFEHCTRDRKFESRDEALAFGRDLVRARQNLEAVARGGVNGNR